MCAQNYSSKIENWLLIFVSFWQVCMSTKTALCISWISSSIPPFFYMRRSVNIRFQCRFLFCSRIVFRFKKRLLYCLTRCIVNVFICRITFSVYYFGSVIFLASLLVFMFFFRIVTLTLQPLQQQNNHEEDVTSLRREEKLKKVVFCCCNSTESSSWKIAISPFQSIFCKHDPSLHFYAPFL